MRAKEFTINIPINIKINGDGEPEVATAEPVDGEMDSNPVFVPPLQQHLELAKAELGKESPVIDKLIAPDDIGAPEEDPLERIKELLSKKVQ
jgi:hypothetical protein